MEALRRYGHAVITGKAQGFFPACLRGGLGLFSVIYGVAAGGIRSLYQRGWLPRHKFDTPVISVGNITWGGVGKTPLVILIAQHIRRAGFRPVILTRGYRRRGMLSDEAELLAESLGDTPILVGRDRGRLARDFLAQDRADVFLLDDGFQHWRIQRDLDIVVIDASNPWGNGRLIPRGILREPVGSLSRADLIVLTKTHRARMPLPELKRRLLSVKDVPIIEARHSPECLEDLCDRTRHDLTLLKDRRVCSFCSVGDPGNFENTIEELGGKVVQGFSFLDHHWYTETDIREVVGFARSRGIDCILTTHKDAVKLGAYLSLFKDVRCLVVRIQLQIIDGQDELFRRITHLSRR